MAADGTIAFDFGTVTLPLKMADGRNQITLELHLPGAPE